MLRAAALLLAVGLAAPIGAAPIGTVPATGTQVGGVPAGGVPAAAAQDDETGGLRWAVQPAGPDGPDGRDWFDYQLAPGAEVVDRVSVTNLGASTVSFSVYATDAYTAAGGGFALLPEVEPATGVGAWISLAADTYAVPAGHRLDIPFRLTVPPNATPGDHAGGVIAAVTSRQARAGGQQLDLDQRVAARVYVRVSGPARPAVAIESMTVTHHNPLLPWAARPTTVTYVVRNTGNVRLTGLGDITVDGPLRWRLASTGAELPELLPGSAVTVTESISGLAPAGRLRVAVRVAPEAGDEELPATTREAAVWAVPWLLFVVLIAGGAGWWAYRRHRRRPRSRRASRGR